MVKVYLITDDLSKYKIGVTRRDVSKRIKELKVGNSNDLRVITTFESKWARKIENSLHKKFKHKLIDGEWFELDENDVLNFTKECIKIHEGFEFISENNTWVQEVGGYK